MENQTTITLDLSKELEIVDAWASGCCSNTADPTEI